MPVFALWACTIENLVYFQASGEYVDVKEEPDDDDDYEEEKETDYPGKLNSYSFISARKLFL